MDRPRNNQEETSFMTTTTTTTTAESLSRLSQERDWLLADWLS